MDDIYFSRKKNNGEEPKLPKTPAGGNGVRGDEEEFHLNFAEVDRSRMEKKIKESFSDTGKKPVRPSDFVPANPYRPVQPLPRQQENRIPRELRDSVTPPAQDYFEEKYSRALPAQEPPVGDAKRAPAAPKHAPVKKKRRGKKRGLKIFISILLIFLICAGGVGVYGFSILNKLNYNTEGIEPNEYISASELMRDKRVKNILFIGCDDADGAKYSRSDTMMLVSIDKANKAIKLTSFLRDSYLYIPARDKKAKLNSACSSGGAQYVIDTLEYNFCIDIERYVLVDFEMFEDIVNALGGVDVDISQKEADFLNKYCSFTGTFDGVNHLAGWQALTYCRIRHLKNETDFNRTERQRKVISAIIAKIKSAEVFNMLSRLDSILENVETDIPKAELVTLGVGALASYLRYDIMQTHIPYGDSGETWNYDTHNGESIIRVDVEKNTEILKDFVFNKSPEDTKKETEE